MPSMRLPQLRWPRRNKRRGQLGIPQQKRSYQLGRVPQRPSRTLLRVPWRGMALTALLLAIAGGLGYGGFWLVDGPALRVQQITISGADIADPIAIANSAAVGKESLLLLDSGAAAARITGDLAAVKRATVSRDWPQGVTIRVTEHVGWGYWQSGGRRVVIDAEGLVIPAGRPPPADATTIFEVAATRSLEPADATTIFEVAATRSLEPGDVVEPDTVTAVRQLIEDARSQRLGIEIQRFEFHADRGLVVRVAGGPDAIFGDWRNYAFKIAAWGALLNRIEREPIDVNEIDLRFGRQLVVR